MVYSINFLRFIAAGLVVLLHTISQFKGKVDSTFSLNLAGADLNGIGSLGVDVFFIISGFVMYCSYRKSQSINLISFYKSRAIRVVPLYWFYTLSYILVSFVYEGVNYDFSFYHFLSSLFFVQWPNYSGIYTPVLNVGWTLTYEMLFYLSFPIVFLLNKGDVTKIFLLSLIFLVCNVVFYTDDFLQTKNALANPILFEFVIGVLLAKYANKILKIKQTIIFIAMCLSLLMLLFVEQGDNGDYYRLFYFGIPAAFVVMFFISQAEVPFYQKKFPVLLGSCSYSLYLSHVFTLPLYILMFIHFNVELSVLWVLLSVPFCTFGAVISYYFIEQPIANFLKSFRRSYCETSLTKHK